MSRRTILLIRWTVFLLACAFLYLRLWKMDENDGFIQLWRVPSQASLLGVLGVVLVLMLANWGVESIKWRVLVRDAEPITPGRAFIATIAGTSIGMITPNRVGEFVGRVLFLAPENRVGASFATAVGSIAQFVVTIVLGTVGLAIMFIDGGNFGPGPIGSTLVMLCAVVAIGSLILFFNPDLLHALVARIPLVRKWEAQAAVLDRFGTRVLLGVLLWSLLRYVIFSVQFTLLLVLFADIPLAETLFAIPVAFLISTLIPTVMLTELGVRGSVAVALISPQAASDQGVFLASTLLWLVNIALPATVGSIVLLVARIRSARS